MQNPRNWLSIR